MLAELDVEPCTEPLQALEQVVGQIVAWKDVCARILNRLRDADLRYASTQELEQVRAEVVLWERSLDRAVTALTSLAKLHVAEQIIRIEQARAAAVVACLGQALHAGEITADQDRLIRVEFARKLRALSA